MRKDLSMWQESPGDLVEGRPALSVDRLHSSFLLYAGAARWWWKVGPGATFSVGLRWDEDASTLRLDFAFPRGGVLVPITQSIPVTETPCRYGGMRPWFLCPGRPGGQGCGRRVGKLYLSEDGFFLCRHCVGLKYSSMMHSHRRRRTAATE